MTTYQFASRLARRKLPPGWRLAAQTRATPPRRLGLRVHGLDFRRAVSWPNDASALNPRQAGFA